MRRMGVIGTGEGRAVPQPMARLPGLALLLVAGCSAPAAPPVQLRPAEVAARTGRPAGRARPDDPARVAGRWDYRTRSNCGRVSGIGEVFLRWEEGKQRYAERGYVYWTDSRSKIEWWGDERHDGDSRVLAGTMKNSLGDSVDSRWRLEGDGPERMVVRWKQTNGCQGVGTATRPAGLMTRVRVRRLIAQLRDDDEARRAAAARELGELGTAASPAILPLVTALEDRSPLVRRAAAEALATMSR